MTSVNCQMDRIQKCGRQTSRRQDLLIPWAGIPDHIQGGAAPASIRFPSCHVTNCLSTFPYMVEPKQASPSPLASCLCQRILLQLKSS